MADIDVWTKEYMSDERTFADLFNYFLYDGKQVIDPNSLKPLDTSLVSIPYGEDDEQEPVQRYRDILKRAVMMSDGCASYLLLGIENQSNIHYAMPVRNMLYDALQYAEQIKKISEKNRSMGRNGTSDEFLSGIYKEDALTPVVTLTF